MLGFALIYSCRLVYESRIVIFPEQDSPTMSGFSIVDWNYNGIIIFIGLEKEE